MAVARTAAIAPPYAAVQLSKVLLVKVTSALPDAKTQPPLYDADPLLRVSPEKVTWVPPPRMSKSCVVPLPLRAAELVLRIVLLTPEIVMVEVMMMLFATKTMKPPEVAYDESSLNVET